MTTLKGLNLPPVQATLLAHGITDRLYQSGKTNHRGKVVLRASMTIPPHGQVVNGVYTVNRMGDTTVLWQDDLLGPSIQLSPGKIVGSACIVDCVRTRSGYEWVFERARITQKRCPRCWANGKFEGEKCPTCNGSKRCQPVDVDAAIRRIWFQW